MRPEVAEARALRKTMSLLEVLLWQQIRRQQIGVKFRRQHPIGAYKPDFACLELRLAIEVDGMAHDCGDRPVRDVMRDRFIAENGYRIVRIPAADILHDAVAVASTIAALGASPLHQPVAGPPPRAGEDQE